MTTRPVLDAHRFGPWALVTGASSGIGAEFARQLAANGLNVVLVARRRRLLEELGDHLAAQTGVQTRVVEADVASADVLDTIARATDDIEVGLVISNASTPLTGRFLDTDLERLLWHARLDVVAPLALTHHCATRMAARRRGGLLLVSAMGAEHGTPLMAASFAGKAYVRILGEGLHAEFSPLGINTTVLLPGPTATPAISAIGFDLLSLPLTPMPVEQCVAEALAALVANRPTIISGRINRLMSAVLPSSLLARMSSRMIGQAVTSKAARAAS